MIVRRCKDDTPRSGAFSAGKVTVFFYMGDVFREFFGA